MMLNKFYQLMIDINSKKSDNFMGLGFIIYDELTSLPISPLKNPIESTNLNIVGYDLILNTLLDVSSSHHHKFHDGFHLISKDFCLTHLSHYFSTPIVPKAPIEYQFGSRYRTALYGSYLTSVVACCIIGSNYHPIVFVKGIKQNPYDFIK